MFGYVQIRKAELKVKDYDVYHSFYCGLCRSLLKRHGIRGQVTLTYDMTFLVMLLSSYYESEVSVEKRRCIVHPAVKHEERITEMSRYGADMNVLLMYFHFVDDRIDEKSIKALGGIHLYQKAYRKIRDRYPYQCRGIVKALKDLRRIEQQGGRGCGRPARCDGALESARQEEGWGSVAEALAAADSFGDLMRVLFTYDEKDAMRHELQGLAFHLGKYIYLMDAYDDLQEDIRKGRYNPLAKVRTEDAAEFRRRIGALLFDEAAKAAAYFEKLPCLQYRDILRNILYAGIWNRYDKMAEL